MSLTRKPRLWTPKDGDHFVLPATMAQVRVERVYMSAGGDEVRCRYVRDGELGGFVHFTLRWFCFNVGVNR